jgi:hypothetical protein
VPSTAPASVSSLVSGLGVPDAGRGVTAGTATASGAVIASPPRPSGAVSSGAGTRRSARTSPKSVTRTRPSVPTRTFSGLKSRWTRFAAWAAARPRPAAR